MLSGELRNQIDGILSLPTQRACRKRSRKSPHAHVVCFTVLLLTLFKSAGAFAEVRVTRLDEQLRFADVVISGRIMQADVEQFRKLSAFLVSQFGVVTANLNSPGGDVLAAIAIGNIVRDNWIWTVIDDNDECSSACVLVFAAGAQRLAGDRSVVRIHRPHFDAALFGQLGRGQAKANYDGLIDEVKGYLSRMGMSDQLFQAMMVVRSDDARTLTLSEMKAFNMVGEDPGYAEWMRAKAKTPSPTLSAPGPEE